MFLLACYHSCEGVFCCLDCVLSGTGKTSIILCYSYELTLELLSFVFKIKFQILDLNNPGRCLHASTLKSPFHAKLLYNCSFRE